MTIKGTDFLFLSKEKKNKEYKLCLPYTYAESFEVNDPEIGRI